MDSWVNWSPDDDGIDYRVKEFFSETYREGMERYNQEIQRYWEKQHAREIEEAERADLARLKNGSIAEFVGKSPPEIRDDYEKKHRGGAAQGAAERKLVSVAGVNLCLQEQSNLGRGDQLFN